MKISELSTITGASVRSLRYYEQKNLIVSKRLDNGYREFDASTVPRVKAIQLYYGLGLNSEQIEKILNCNGKHEILDVSPTCEGLLLLYKKKLQEINEQVETLLEVKGEIEKRIDSIANRDFHLNTAVQ